MLRVGRTSTSAARAIPYVAGWGEDGALDAIREYAQTIDTIARRIEDALDPKPEPADDAVGSKPSQRRRAVGRGLRRPDDRASPAGGRVARRSPTATRAGRAHPERGSCSPRPTPHTPTHAGDEDELYRRHHRELHRAVSRAVHAPRETIEDACQTAWAILLRRQPERDAVFAWLRVVAVHEAYRLSAIESTRRAARAAAPRGRRMAGGHG